MKNFFSTKTPILLFLAATLLSSGCASHVEGHATPPAGIIVKEPPPEPLPEGVSKPPSGTEIWVGGRWDWEDRWMWHPGHWDEPPRHGARWIPSHYEFRDGTHIMHPGYWSF